MAPLPKHHQPAHRRIDGQADVKFRDRELSPPAVGAFQSTVRTQRFAIHFTRRRRRCRHYFAGANFP